MAETGLFCRGERVELLEGQFSCDWTALQQLASFSLYGARCAVGAEPASVPTYGEPGCGGYALARPFMSMKSRNPTTCWWSLKSPIAHRVLIIHSVSTAACCLSTGAGVPVWIINLVHDQTGVYLEPEGADYRVKNVCLCSPHKPRHFPDLSHTLVSLVQRSSTILTTVARCAR